MGTTSANTWPKDLSQNPLALVPTEVLGLMPGFLERRWRDLAQLKGLLRRRDFRELQNLGHQIKGTAANYGLPQLSDIARELEFSAQAQDAARIESLIQDFAICTARMQDQLDSAS